MSFGKSERSLTAAARELDRQSQNPKESLDALERRLSARQIKIHTPLNKIPAFKPANGSLFRNVVQINNSPKPLQYSFPNSQQSPANQIPPILQQPAVALANMTPMPPPPAPRPIPLQVPQQPLQLPSNLNSLIQVANEKLPIFQPPPQPAQPPIPTLQTPQPQFGTFPSPQKFTPSFNFHFQPSYKFSLNNEPLTSFPNNNMFQTSSNFFLENSFLNSGPNMPLQNDLFTNQFPFSDMNLF